MKPSIALERHMASMRSAASRHKLANPRVFGSVDSEGSDICILVDPLPDATLFDLGGFQEEMERLLGTRVDVLTLDDLPASVRVGVLSESKPL